MNPPPRVLIFRGAPASGKGTLTQELCAQLPKPVALIEQDRFRWGVHVIGRSVPDISIEEHAFAHRNMKLIYEQYLQSGNYTIVLEGVFTWDAIAPDQGSAKELAALAKQHGFTCQSIVLKASKQTLLNRNAKRPYSVPIVEFNTLYKNIYRTIDDSEIVVDSTGQDTGETIRTLKALLS
jgi:predicted kinase